MKTTKGEIIATFQDLTFVPKFFGDGKIAKIYFDNGYGASIITGLGAYANEGEYELAVLRKDKGLCYDTPITNNVIGHQTPNQITELLKQIEALPPKL